MKHMKIPKIVKKSFIIPFVIYPFDVMVNIGMTIPENIKKIEKFYDLREPEKAQLTMTGSGRTFMLERGQIIIQLRDTDIGLIAHEAFHAVCFLFDKIGCELTDESEEAYAYTQEYLINEINKKL